MMMEKTSNNNISWYICFFGTAYLSERFPRFRSVQVEVAAIVMTSAKRAKIYLGRFSTPVG